MESPLHLRPQASEHYEFAELIYGRNHPSAVPSTPVTSSTDHPPCTLIQSTSNHVVPTAANATLNVTSVGHNYSRHPSTTSSTSTNISSQVECIKQKASPNTIIYSCDSCDRKFKKASCFSKHKRGAHNQPRNSNISIKNKILLKSKKCSAKKPRVVPDEFKPYECTICNAKFIDKGNGELHLERAHNTRESLLLQTSKTCGFACPDCNVWFNDRQNLRDHQLQDHQSITSSMSQPIEPPAFHTHSNLQSMSTQYFFQPFQSINSSSGNQNVQSTSSHQQPLISQVNPEASQSHSMSPATPHSPQQQIYSSSVQTLPQPIQENCSTNANAKITNSAVGLVNKSYEQVNYETPKIVKSPKVNIASSKQSICGECGLKFVDPINVELHMTRVHPNIAIQETIDLGDGVILYKTENTDNLDLNISFVNKNIANLDTSTQTKLSFKCALCDHVSRTLRLLVRHLEKRHDTNNANFIIISEGKTNSDNYQNSTDGTESDICFCDSCFREFTSQLQLIEHFHKDRNIVCNVCSITSCSVNKIDNHMQKVHRSRFQSGDEFDKTQPLSGCKMNSKKLTSSQTESTLVNEGASVNSNLCDLSFDRISKNPTPEKNRLR